MLQEAEHAITSYFPTNDIEAPTPFDTLRAFTALAHLAGYYPGFKSWYWDKVVPGLQDGSRRLDVVQRSGRIVGICIAKKTSEESKICSLWVVPSHRGTGVGVRMIMDAMGWLGTSKPSFTVCEERHDDFAAIFRRLGFHEPTPIIGMHRADRIEYAYGRIVGNA